MTKRKPTESDPFALLFPAVEGEQFKGLVASFQAHGFLRQFPIHTSQGTVRDDRTRQRAEEDAGVEPVYHEFDGDDAAALAFVCAANAVRRHLTNEQKREVIAGVVKQNPELSDRQVARMVGVTPTTVGAVRATVQNGQ